jgi:hypothetical protein
MRIRTVIVALAATAVSSVSVASGPVGIYGVIERVVFEPDEARPERVQVWGAFVYADGDDSTNTSPVARGYLYFSLPPASAASPGELDVVRREWLDLQAVAGTGQAVGFGRWGYIGRFAGLRLDGTTAPPSYVPERAPQRGAPGTMRVRPASERPSQPAEYRTNAGVVKLPDSGSHADIVRALRSAIGR